MRLLPLCLALAIVGPRAACGAGEDENQKQIKEGLAAFEAFLKKTHPEKKYKVGPNHLDSAAIRAAYPGQRFYFVFTSIPLAPGANIGGVQEAYRRKVEDIRKNYLSLTVRVDEQGQVIPLLKPEDYNVKLKRIENENDVRIAATAISSLISSDHNGPCPLDPKEVTVTKMGAIWSCRITHKSHPQRVSQDDFHANLTFETDGKCSAVTKSYGGPQLR